MGIKSPHIARTIAEIKLYLQIDGDSLNPLLDSGERQGLIQKSLTREECQTCQKCPSEEREFSEWV